MKRSRCVIRWGRRKQVARCALEGESPARLVWRGNYLRCVGRDGEEGVSGPCVALGEATGREVQRR